MLHLVQDPAHSFVLTDNALTVAFNFLPLEGAFFLEI